MAGRTKEQFETWAKENTGKESANKRQHCSDFGKYRDFIALSYLFLPFFLSESVAAAAGGAAMVNSLVLTWVQGSESTGEAHLATYMN